MNQKAIELENEIKIQENLKIAAKKAKEEAARKAAEERAKAEAERRRQAEEARKQPSAEWGSMKKTVDLSELYAGLPAEANVQISDEGFYRHHSAFWEANVEKQADNLENEMAKVEEFNPELRDEPIERH